MTVISTNDTGNFVSIGVWLVCEIVSSVLFGVLTVQCSFYFSRFPNDKWGYKALVSLSWLLEFFNEIFTLWWTYELQIHDFGLVALKPKFEWMPGLLCAITSVNAVLAQLFFARRGYLLSHSVWPLSLFSVALAVLGFVAGIMVSVELITGSVSGDLPEDKWIKSLWTLSEAIADILVASIVVYSLSARRKAAYTSIRKGVGRLMVYTISNGLLTSILALVEFGLFPFLPQSGAHPGFGLVLGRIYANSLLASLNLRGTWIQDKKPTSSAEEPISRAEPPHENPPIMKSINEVDDGLFNSPIEPQCG
ncbi:hypothetical protein DL93DRAFT_1427276 [Clavulina sp. PMI_390]|nr:hypothetical protein DL93DRAFT_1427276 [Clavulina sp. PMI_390]